MKKIVALLCFTLFFSCENVDDVAQQIYDNNVDQPGTYGLNPPSSFHGTWITEDQNVSIMGFTFEARDILLIRSSGTESFTTMIANNPSLRIEDFYQTSSTNYYKIYQIMQGGDKLWYDFYKRSNTELVLIEGQSSMIYYKQ